MQNKQHKNWQYFPVSQPQLQKILTEMPLSSVIAEILLRRGLVEPSQIDAFLSPSLNSLPDPGLMKGVNFAVDRLLQALQKNEKVLVYGDYDVDGISATALLVQFFRRVGLQTGYHIPSRMKDGYGLNNHALRRYIADGFSLLVTVDCGISNVSEVDFARQRGMDVIITDHHEPPSFLPAANAIINPKQHDCLYPEKNLAGVGVAFNLLIALRRALRQRGSLVDELNLRRYLDLVALGTIADVVPLTGVNRILVKFGLEEIASGHRTGIMSLMNVSRVDIEGKITAQDIAFKLAPRLNAAGRLDSVHDALELLLTGDTVIAASQAERLQDLNQRRRQIEEAIFKEIDEQLSQNNTYGGNNVIVLASSEWHEGVIGIVASKLAERYFQPTMLVSINDDGVGKASGRSIPGLHLLDLIGSCKEYLIRYGGHQMAVGFSIDENNLVAFRDSLDHKVGQLMATLNLQPKLEIDGRLAFRDLSFNLLAELNRLEPYGYGNPEPVFLLENLCVNRAAVVGSNHLRLQFKDSNGIGAIAFNMGNYRVIAGNHIDLVCTPQINNWNGNESIQLLVKDMRQF